MYLYLSGWRQSARDQPHKQCVAATALNTLLLLSLLLFCYCSQFSVTVPMPLRRHAQPTTLLYPVQYIIYATTSLLQLTVNKVSSLAPLSSAFTPPNAVTLCGTVWWEK